MSTVNAGCDCAEEVSADFLMEEMTSFNLSNSEYTDTDTMYAEGQIHFYALEDNADYTWYIGAEVIKEREFYRYFDASLIGQTLPMKLVVNKKPNNICLPNDDGVDSIVRKLVITKELVLDDFFTQPNYLLEGMFRLKDVNATDSVDVKIDILYPLEPGPGGTVVRYVLTNLDGTGKAKVCSLGGDYTYRQIWFKASGYSQVRLFHRMDGIVELEMTPYEGVSDPPYYFKGRKLN